MDFGAEEIEFYTLNYPKSIGEDWEVENALNKELTEVRSCMPNRILFLDASDDVLRSHKQHDDTRTRNFFEHHLQHLMPLKRKWFLNKENVDWLMIDDLSADEYLNTSRAKLSERFPRVSKRESPSPLIQPQKQRAEVFQ